MRPPVKRAPRIGDGKISFIPNDADHDGWLLLGSTIRMVGKVEYAKLFTIFGTTYGGTAQSTTFGLPPAGDKFLLTAGQNHALGETGGVEAVTLSTAQMPKHKHGYDKPSLGSPQNVNVVGSVLGGVLTGLSIPKPTVTAGQDGGDAGGGEAHPNMPPYLTVNVFIFAGMPQA